MITETKKPRWVRCRVSDLHGIALDLAVALCAGDAQIDAPVYMSPVRSRSDLMPRWGVPGSVEPFSPSQNGEHARLFIEEAGIGLRKTAKGWTARIWNLAVATGPDYLTAAMRCFVMSVEDVRTSLPAEFIERHYGFALDIPAELLKGQS